MKFIEEVVVEEFLPTFRSMLAEDLRDRVLTQHEVAEALGISQSAVSKYAHGDVSRRDVVVTDNDVKTLVDQIGSGLTTGDISRVQALVESEVLIRRLESGGVIARLHEESMPELEEYDGYSRIHDPEGGLRTSEQVRSSLRRALRRLTNITGFANLIPNVGSNLVACLPDATTVDDVAGVPGRIFDVKGDATVPGDPEFGVSEHVASVLLTARENGFEFNSAINICYETDLVEQLSTAGYKLVEFDPDADADADADADPIQTAFSSIRNNDDVQSDMTPAVCYHTGGYGVEPIIYILAGDAEIIVEIVQELLAPEMRG